MQGLLHGKSIKVKLLSYLRHFHEGTWPKFHVHSVDFVEYERSVLFKIQE